MTNIESVTSAWMNKLFSDYTKTFIADGRAEPYDRAYTKAVTIGLRKATNRAGIMTAVNNMQKNIGYRQIPLDVYDYLITQGESNPLDLRELLILACAIRFNANPTAITTGVSK